MENTKGMSTKMKLVGMGKVVKEAVSETSLMMLIFIIGLHRLKSLKMILY